MALPATACRSAPALDNLTGTSYETYIGFPGPGRAFWVGLGWDR